MFQQVHGESKPEAEKLHGHHQRIHSHSLAVLLASIFITVWTILWLAARLTSCDDAPENSFSGMVFVCHSEEVMGPLVFVLIPISLAIILYDICMLTWMANKHQMLASSRPSEGTVRRVVRSAAAGYSTLPNSHRGRLKWSLALVLVTFVAFMLLAFATPMRF